MLQPIIGMVILSAGFFQSVQPGVSTISQDTLKVKYHFNPVVVTATRHAHAQRDLAASISIVEVQDMELAATPSSLETLQRYIPSYHLTEWGIMGFGATGQAAGKLSMRGLGGSANTHILILRNGRPDFMGLMGCTVADEFCTDGVGRIEVIRGPASFLYGTNATGGIINLLPRTRQKPGIETRISAGAGDFHTGDLTLSHGGRQGNLDYYITAGHRQTRGHRSDSDYEGRHYSAHVGFQSSPRLSLEANANISDIWLLDPGPASAPRKNNWYDMLRGGFDLTMRHRRKPGDLNIKVHANFGKHRFFDGWQSTDRTWGFMAYQSITPWNGQQTILGFEAKQYGGSARDASTDHGTHWITEAAPYIHLQQLMAGKFILSAGLRTEHHSLYGWELLPKAGLVMHASKLFTWRLSAAKGFRSPSIRELYFWMPANDDLTPDRVWNMETALRGHWAEKARFEMIYFHSQGSNLIQFSGPPPLWINSGVYKLNGLELTTEVQLSNHWQWGGSWSYIKPQDTALLNAPGQKATSFLRWQKASWAAELSLLMVKDLTGVVYEGASPVPRYVALEDYTLMNATIRIPMARSFAAKLALKNILNQRYESMTGYPMPERTFMLHFDYVWEK